MKKSNDPTCLNERAAPPLAALYALHNNKNNRNHNTSTDDDGDDFNTLDKFFFSSAARVLIRTHRRHSFIIILPTGWLISMKSMKLINGTAMG